MITARKALIGAGRQEHRYVGNIDALQGDPTGVASEPWADTVPPSDWLSRPVGARA